MPLLSVSFSLVVVGGFVQNAIKLKQIHKRNLWDHTGAVVSIFPQSEKDLVSSGV